MQPGDLSRVLRGKVVIVGIGNELRADDGFGPALIQKLAGQVNAVCIDAGTAPENFTRQMVREAPDTILLVDALHLGLAPGQYEILTKQEIAECGLSTHDISPNMLIDYLQSQTDADIYILGVQPQNLGLGQEMSGSVKQAVEEVAEAIKAAVDG